MRRLRHCVWIAACCLAYGAWTPAWAAGVPALLHARRGAASDLEVQGAVAGYVAYADLRRLPQATVTVTNDENFAIRVKATGVYLDVLAHALGVADTDVMEAVCSDGYRAHYPQSYVAAHRPILALKIDGRSLAAWARRTHTDDPGPYLITQAHFVPALKVLSHVDRPQVPTNVVQLNFVSEAEIFGKIAPRGAAETSPAVQAGFVIAKQNCLRCHNAGAYGGTKAGRSWWVLASDAKTRPKWFEAYVRAPQLADPDAKAPGNPEYDGTTLAAVMAYFSSMQSGGVR